MGFTLEVTFAGLIAFVSAPHAADPYVYALALDATEASYASDGREIPGHKALLVFCCKDLLGKKCSSDDATPEAMADLWLIAHGGGAPGTPPCGDGVFGARILDGLSVKIEQANVSNPLAADDLGYAAQALNVKSGDGKAHVDRTLIDWDDETLADSYQAYAALMAARIKFSKGSMSVGAKTGKDFYFASLHDHATQLSGKPLVELIEASLVVATDSITITFASFRGAKGNTSPLTFAPEANKTARLAVANLAECPQWLYEKDEWHCSDSYPGDPNRGNQHFESYFALVANAPPSTYRPVPKQVGSILANSSMMDTIEPKGAMDTAKAWVKMFNLMDRPCALRHCFSLERLWRAAILLTKPAVAVAAVARDAAAGRRRRADIGARGATTHCRTGLLAGGPLGPPCRPRFAAAAAILK